jgi:hypothetical protein
VKEGVNKSNHPIQNPLLIVAEPRTRENMYVSMYVCSGMPGTHINQRLQNSGVLLVGKGQDSPLDEILVKSINCLQSFTCSRKCNLRTLDFRLLSCLNILSFSEILLRFSFVVGLISLKFCDPLEHSGNDTYQTL